MPHITDSNSILMLDKEEFLLKAKIEQFLNFDINFDGSGEILDLDKEENNILESNLNFQDLITTDTTPPSISYDLTTVRAPDFTTEQENNKSLVEPTSKNFDPVQYFYDLAIFIIPIFLVIIIAGFVIYLLLKYKKSRKDSGRYNPQEIEKKIGVINPMNEEYFGKPNEGFETRYDRGLIRFLQLPVEEKLI